MKWKVIWLRKCFHVARERDVKFQAEGLQVSFKRRAEALSKGNQWSVIRTDF